MGWACNFIPRKLWSNNVLKRTADKIDDYAIRWQPSFPQHQRDKQRPMQCTLSFEGIGFSTFMIHFGSHTLQGQKQRTTALVRLSRGRSQIT